MGEESVHLLRETLLTCDIEPRKLRRIVTEYRPLFRWRILWLRPGVFLAVSHVTQSLSSGALNADDVVTFARSSDSELEKVSRIAAIITGQRYSISALPQRFVYVIDATRQLGSLTPKDSASFVGPEVQLLMKPAAVPVLATRPDGVRLFYDASVASSSARKVSECFRLLEAAFGLKGSRLQRPIVSFLATGLFRSTAVVG